MKTAFKILALGAAIAASTTLARADAITGSITITGATVTWNSTGVSFNPTAPATSPNATAYDATGTFANFASSSLLASAGTAADVYDFTYTGSTGDYLFAAGPSSTDYIGLTITSISVVSDTSDFLNITGTGMLADSAGDTPTYATFSLTSTGDENSSYTIDSGVPAAAAPEPSSLALLGTTLLGAAGIARRRFMSR